MPHCNGKSHISTKDRANFMLNAILGKQKMFCNFLFWIDKIHAFFSDYYRQGNGENSFNRRSLSQLAVQSALLIANYRVEGTRIATSILRTCKLQYA